MQFESFYILIAVFFVFLVEGKIATEQDISAGKKYSNNFVSDMVSLRLQCDNFITFQNI